MRQWLVRAWGAAQRNYRLNSRNTFMLTIGSLMGLLGILVAFTAFARGNVTQGLVTLVLSSGLLCIALPNAVAAMRSRRR